MKNLIREKKIWFLKNIFHQISQIWRVRVIIDICWDEKYNLSNVFLREPYVELWEGRQKNCGIMLSVTSSQHEVLISWKLSMSSVLSFLCKERKCRSWNFASLIIFWRQLEKVYLLGRSFKSLLKLNRSQILSVEFTDNHFCNDCVFRISMIICRERKLATGNRGTI